MSSPFPGMDPYLEDAIGGPDVHHRLITMMGDHLAAAVSPHFYVRIEERVYITHTDDDPGYSVIVPDVIVTRRPRPVTTQPVTAGTAVITPPVVIEDLLDPEIHDHYIEIRDARSHEIVTAIELLSPANKVKGSRGRQTMEEKRCRLRQGGAHWMEIDLLRDGQRHAKLAGRSDCCVLLLRNDRSEGLAWFFSLRDSLPEVDVPLRPPHEDVKLDLQRVLNETYDRAHYADSVDYTRPRPGRLSSRTTPSGHGRQLRRGWLLVRPINQVRRTPRRCVARFGSASTNPHALSAKTEPHE